MSTSIVSTCDPCLSATAAFVALLLAALGSSFTHAQVQNGSIIGNRRSPSILLASPIISLYNLIWHLTTFILQASGPVSGHTSTSSSEKKKLWLLYYVVFLPAIRLGLCSTSRLYFLQPVIGVLLLQPLLSHISPLAARRTEEDNMQSRLARAIFLSSTHLLSAFFLPPLYDLFLESRFFHGPAAALFLLGIMPFDQSRITSSGLFVFVYLLTLFVLVQFVGTTWAWTRTRTRKYNSTPEDVAIAPILTADMMAVWLTVLVGVSKPLGRKSAHVLVFGEAVILAVLFLPGLDIYSLTGGPFRVTKAPLVASDAHSISGS